MLRERVVLSATFKVDPILESIFFWQTRLGLKTEFRIAPCNQVLQQLMYPDSLLRSNQSGLNILLVRASDWIVPGQDTGNCPTAVLSEFGELLKGASGIDSATSIVLLCPERSLSGADQLAYFPRLYSSFKRACGRDAHLLDGIGIAKRYRCDDIHDQSAASLVGIPYSRPFFAALGTEIVRTLVGLDGSPLKLIAFDCDGTLWSGNCGEVTPAKLRVDGAHRTLQEFLVACYHRGCLLVACSKNEYSAVRNVFRSRTDMPLREEQIASWKVSWQPKSLSILQLALEFECSRDAILVIDDDLFQCEEVRANCPGALTFRLSEPLADSVDRLRRSWIHDSGGLTTEDKSRSRFYAQNTSRQLPRKASRQNLERFLDESELVVQIHECTVNEIQRVVQLSARVTQFNTSCKRWENNDLLRVLASPDFICRCVQVKDRFGTYGIVGAFVLQIGPPTATVHSMLLSCRALGRFVEDTMMADIALTADRRKCTHVLVHFTKTSRNIPAQRFVAGLAGHQTDRPGELRFSVADLLERRKVGKRSFGYVLSLYSESHTSDYRPGVMYSFDGGGESSVNRESLLLETGEFKTAAEIVKACCLEFAHGVEVDTSSANSVESTLLGIWRQVLRDEHVGIEDDIFDLGADSLTTVEILTAINELLDIELPLSTIFSCQFSVRNMTPICIEALRSKCA